MGIDCGFLDLAHRPKVIQWKTRQPHKQLRPGMRREGATEGVGSAPYFVSFGQMGHKFYPPYKGTITPKQEDLISKLGGTK